MTEQQFQLAMGAAEIFQRLAEKPAVTDFWAGYIRGTRRLYHGEQFGTDSEHEKWLDSITSDDESRQRRGAGYRAGYTGESIDVAMIAAEQEIKGAPYPPSYCTQNNGKCETCSLVNKGDRLITEKAQS